MLKQSISIELLQNFPYFAHISPLLALKISYGWLTKVNRLHCLTHIHAHMHAREENMFIRKSIMYIETSICVNCIAVRSSDWTNGRRAAHSNTQAKRYSVGVERSAITYVSFFGLFSFRSVESFLYTNFNLLFKWVDRQYIAFVALHTHEL